MSDPQIKRIIITSGPTVEPIDPIRFLSNRSSGKTGFYLAEEAVNRGIQEIIFITGPTGFIPSGVRLIQVETAVEMRSQIFKFFEKADILIMAAAVSDYRCVKYYTDKIKSNKESIKLEFKKNPDIIQELGQKKSDSQVLVGFAAETENLFENAIEKLNKKNLDFIVLNEISENNPAFSEDFNQVYFVTGRGIKKLERMKKSEIASHIFDELYSIISKKK